MKLDIQMLVSVLEDVAELLEDLEKYEHDEVTKPYIKFLHLELSEIIEILKSSEKSKIIKLAVKLYNYLNTKKGVS